MHSKIKFVSPRSHVISSISFSLLDSKQLDHLSMYSTELTSAYPVT